MRRSGLSVAAKAVYAALATYADRNGWAWTKQETLAADLERSRAWVHAAIAELEGQGLLRHDRQFIEGRQRASRYQLLDGLTRGAVAQKGFPADQAALVSVDADSAVKPTDTKQHEGFQDSLSTADAREPGGHSVQEIEVPADWVPNTDDVAWARARHPALDILRFTETFILSCQAKGYRYANISAAWRRWLCEPKGKLPLLLASKTSTDIPEDRRYDRSSQQQRRPAPSPNAPGGLSPADHDKAARILERLTARRAGHQPAGSSA
jgi:hypothetical protein